jgi:small subunit ribosomal protein S1
MTENKNEKVEQVEQEELNVPETPVQEDEAPVASKNPVELHTSDENDEELTEAKEEVNDLVQSVEVQEASTKESKPEKTKSGKKQAEEEDFDWESLELGLDAYSASQRENLENMYDNTLNTVTEKEVLDGTVIALNKREVVVDIGYKSDGIVSLNEFRYNPELKVGDKVEVYIESLEDKKGQMILSHKKARATRSWDRVNEALEKNEIIKGYIKCRTKGGMIVDVFGIEAFLPGSQIDVKPIRDYDVFVGKTMEFKVVKSIMNTGMLLFPIRHLLKPSWNNRKKKL